MMKRIISLFVLFSLLMFSGFAVNTYDSYNNPDKITEFNNKVYDEISRYHYIIFYNSSFDLDLGRNYRIGNKPILEYSIFNNNDVTKEFVFVTIYKQDNQTYAYGNFINITGGGSASVIVEPTTDYEYVATEIYCKDNSSTCGAGYQVTKFLLVERKEGVNTIFTPLIGATIDLIQININIWKIIYYLFVSSIMVGLIYVLFRIGFYLIDKTKKLSKTENEIYK